MSAPGFARVHLVLGAIVLLLMVLMRGMLEALMLSHMLVQLPLIFTAGWLLGAPLIQRSAALARYDRHGLAGLTSLLFISAYWMIPRALELSMNHWPSELAKFAVFLALGAVLPASLSRAATVIQLFYLGNFCAMAAITGMLYQDLPEQLCNAYPQDDQIMTGGALIVAAVATAIVWCIRHFSALSAPTLSE